MIEKASHFDYEFYLGHKIVFVCVARGFPRPKITWFKDGVEIFGHPYVQVSGLTNRVQRNANYTIVIRTIFL